MFCKKCGKEMDEEMTFCPFCGQEQTEGIADSTEKKDNISNKQMIIAGVIMAAVILAVIGVFKLLGREPEEDKTADMPVEAEADSEVQQAEDLEEEAVGSTESETEKETVEILEDSEPETAETPQISHIVTDEYEYWFDEDGDLIKVKEDTGVWDIQYLTDSMGNKIEGKISKNWLELREDWPVAWPDAEELFYLEGHLIESVSFIGNNGVGDAFITYTYDGENVTAIRGTDGWVTDGYRNWDLSFQYEADRIIVSEYYEISGENWNEAGGREYTCFFDGNKKVECVCNGDGYNSYKVWEYDENGKLLSEKEDYDYYDYYVDASHVSTTEANEFIYDAEGNLIRHEYTDIREHDGVEFSLDKKIYAYQYDKDGNELKTERHEIRTEKGTKASETYSTSDSQYDENGNKVQLSATNKSFDYDETGTVVKQDASDLNYIWEYDAEGKVIYSSSLVSSTGNDIWEWKEEYLYDEQGRLTEIRTDGETAVEISYTDEGLFRQSNVLKDGASWSRPRPENLISNLIPEDGKAAMETFRTSSNNILIEYR